MVVKGEIRSWFSSNFTHPTMFTIRSSAVKMTDIGPLLLVFLPTFYNIYNPYHMRNMSVIFFKLSISKYLPQLEIWCPLPLKGSLFLIITCLTKMPNNYSMFLWTLYYVYKTQWPIRSGTSHKKSYSMSLKTYN